MISKNGFANNQGDCCLKILSQVYGASSS